MRRTSIMVVVALLAGLAGVVGGARPAWANNGESLTQLSVSPDPSAYGTAIRMEANVWDDSDSCLVNGDCNSPDGRVDFWYALPTGDFNASKQFLVSAELGAGSTTIIELSEADADYCCLPVGTWLIRAFYVPDTGSVKGEFDPSSGDDTITVNQRGTTTSLSQSSTTTTFGQSVTFTAQVATSGLHGNASKPTGFVSVFETTASGSITYGTAAIDAAGTATVSTTALTVGSHSIRARYAGDTRFTGGDSAPVTHQVNRTASSGTLTVSSTNPKYGDSVTFTDAVTPTTATGLVTFTSALAGTIGTGSLAGGGGSSNVIQVSTTSLPVGSQSVTATYAGDTNTQGNTSNTVIVNVARANTTTSLISSLADSRYGQPVTFTATVGGPGSATPSGTVQFKDSGAALGAPQTLVSGVATLVTSTLPAGSHTITAEYSGDGNYNASSSGPASLVVSRADTTTSLTSSLNPSSLGDVVTFTATVAAVAPGGGTPGGAIQFKDGTRGLGAPVALSGGVAVFSTKYLRPGAHAITAQYTGASNYNPSSGAVSQTVSCTRTYTGSFSTLAIPSTGSTCLDRATVGSGLIIPSGARVSIAGSSVRGAIQADGGALGLTICNSAVTGNLTVKGATDFLLLGDVPEEVCAGNWFNSSVTLTENSGGLNLGDNVIGGDVSVTNNVGAGPAPYHSSPEIERNNIRGRLACTGNNPTASNDGRPNSAASRTGECGAAGF